MKAQTTILAIQAALNAAENDRLGEAIELLGDTWRGPLSYPEITDPELKAEILTAVGDVTGRIGHAQQIAGSQEHAKNLLSEAIALFEDSGKETADAQIRLATTYLREGSYDECAIILGQARPNTDHLKAKSLLIQAILHRVCGRPKAQLEILKQAEPFFDSIEGVLKGKFHHQRGIALMELGEADRAIIEYQAASIIFELAGSKAHQAAVRNNRSHLFLELRDSEKALELVDRALVEAQSESDIAACLETKARILLQAGCLDEAYEAVNEAVGIFRQGDEHSPLSEALVTQGRILSQLGRESRQVFCFLQ